MVTWFALMVWLGGIGPAYRKEREVAGAVVSLLNAIVWPWGLGTYLAREFYVPEDQ